MGKKGSTNGLRHECVAMGHGKHGTKSILRIVLSKDDECGTDEHGVWEGC